MTEAKILLVHGQPEAFDMLRVYFLAQGYQVSIASDEEAAIDRCLGELPSIVVAEPAVGLELLVTLRSLPSTSHVPVVFLANSNESKISALEQGANDFLVTPLDLSELRLRVRNLIALAEVRDLHNPLTGLPSAKLAERQIAALLYGAQKWAALWLSLDHFGPFREAYGHAASEDVQRLVATICRAAAEEGTWNEIAYQSAADEFIIVTTPDRVDCLVDQIFVGFEREIHRFYAPSDSAAGYFMLADRQGVSHQVPLLSLSVGVVTNLHRRFANFVEVREAASQVLSKARQVHGNSVWIDRRRGRLDAAQTGTQG